MALNPRFAAHFLWAQFHTIPLPAPGTFAGQTIIVTGANVGLGLEAARHFVRLGAARVIVACRSVEKAEAAVKNIRASLTPEEQQASASSGQRIEAWDVDLGSFASVAAFCRRAAAELGRLDAVVENAGLATGEFVLLEAYESTITVNVLSTFLMALLLLPVLRKTATQHNVRPRLTIVSSDAHYFARFAEQKEDNILAAFKDKASFSHDRYNVSKLLEILVVRQLAQVLEQHHVPVTLNTLNPGLCRTELFRGLPVFVRPIAQCILLLLGRTADMGSRNLVSAAAAGPESHGQYLDTTFVHAVSPFVASAAGKAAQEKVYDELLDVLEGVQPGIKKNLE